MIEKAFDQLFTLDSRNKVRVFECEVHYNEINENYYILTKTGLLGGKLIEKKETVSTRKNIGKKNETTLGGQALLQADSLWRCKQHEGYKSFRQMLEYNSQSTSGYQIIRGEFTVESHIEKFLRNYEEASQTNENWDYLPMLAVKYKDVKKREYPYYSQPKYNGVRCFTRVKKNKFANWTIKLGSRGGEYYKVPHIEDAVREIAGILESNNYPLNDFILDGELYKHGVPLQEISGAARTEIELSMFATNSWLEYHIYDVINLNVAPPIQRDRLTELLAIEIIVNQHHIKWDKIKFVKTKIVHDEQEVKDLHDEYIAQGYEGEILRKPNAIYEFNQRSKGLIKVKEFIDGEFIIRGCGSSGNDITGESFVFILKNDINDEIFESRPTGSLAQKLKWKENIVDFIGKKATVRYQERSNKGIPIQGTLRSDLTEVLHIRPQGE